MARQQAQASRLILDSGAVIALARRKSRARLQFEETYDRYNVVIVPAVVVAEVIRGGSADAIVNRFLSGTGDSEPAAGRSQSPAKAGSGKRMETKPAIGG